MQLSKDLYKHFRYRFFYELYTSTLNKTEIINEQEELSGKYFFVHNVLYDFDYNLFLEIPKQISIKHQDFFKEIYEDPCLILPEVNWKKGTITKIIELLFLKLNNEEEDYKIRLELLEIEGKNSKAVSYIKLLLKKISLFKLKQIEKEIVFLEKEYLKNMNYYTNLTKDLIVEMICNLKNTNKGINYIPRLFNEYLNKFELINKKEFYIIENDYYFGSFNYFYKIKNLLEYSCVSYADFLIYYQKWSLLYKFLLKFSFFIKPEFAAHYISIFYYLKKNIPLGLFAKIYIERGSDTRYATKTNLENYLKTLDKEEFSYNDKYELVYDIFNEIKNEDSNWFEFYLKKHSVKDKFKLKILSSRSYKYGLFNFTKWNTSDSRINFKKDHIFYDSYPNFGGEASDNLEYSLQRYNLVSVKIRNKIRTFLELPLVGEGKIRETQIYKILKENTDFIIKREYSPEFLGLLRYDFYIVELNIAVEWNGKQHYEPIDFFGGEDSFNKTVKRDMRKRILSEKNGIKLIELKYDLKDEEVIEIFKSHGIIK